MNGLTPLQQIAYDAVCKILDMKRGAVEPCLEHISEIRNSINVELMEALRMPQGLSVCESRQKQEPDVSD